MDKGIQDVTLGRPWALSSSHTSTDRHNSSLTILECKQIVEVMFDDNDTNVGINFGIKAKVAVSATVAALTMTVKMNVTYLVLITSLLRMNRCSQRASLF
jgi:hypothetical protein